MWNNLSYLEGKLDALIGLSTHFLRKIQRQKNYIIEVMKYNIIFYFISFNGGLQSSLILFGC